MSLNQLKSDSFTSYLFSNIESLESATSMDLMRTLQYSVKSMKPCAVPIENKIRKVSAVMTEPTGVSDNPIKFTAGLTCSVPVEATLENIQSVSQVKLQVYSKYICGQSWLKVLS